MAGAVSISVNLVGRNMLGSSLTSVASGFNSIASAGSRLSGLLTSLNSNTGRLTLGAAAAGLTFAAFAGLIKVGASGAVELQDKLLMLRQALQANSDAMPVLTTAVNDLGVKTVYSSSEAADAFAALVRMGFNASQVMYGAGAAANEYTSHAYNAQEATHGLGFEALALGQALHMGATDGAVLAATAVQTFGQEVRASANPTKAASAIVNDLAGAYLNGAQSGSDLLSFMRQAGPTAASMGVHFRDLVTTGSVLAQAMGGIGVAGLRLRYMLSTMVHPTAAQSKELAFLGLTTVDTGTKFNTFAGKLEAAGLVSAKQVQQWKGSQTGLENLFKVAQGAGMIPLDQNFQQWALSTGLLSSKLYDSHGNFISTKNAVDQLMTSLKNKTPEERMQALATLFNVRGGDAGKILTSLTNFDQQYDTIWKRIGKTDVVSMAMQQLQTFRGASQALSDSLKSGLAVAFLQLLPPITSVMNMLNNLLEGFLQASPAVQTAVGVFLLVGAALSGIAAVGLAVAAIVGVVGAAAAAAGVSIGVFAGIVLGIPIAIIAVTAGLVALGIWLHSLGLNFDGLGRVVQVVMGLMRAVAATLGGILGPIFSELGSQLKGSLLPAWHSLQQAFILLLPVIKLIGTAILGTLVVVFGILVASLSGLIVILANVVAGIIKVFAGMAQVISGIVKAIVDLWTGFFGILKGIFDGNGNEIRAAWNGMWKGLQSDAANIAHGLLTVVSGLFQATWKAVGQGVVAFVQTIISYFQHLADVLVGHSIVPDMVSAIVSWFAQLPGRAGAAISSFVSGVISRFGQMASQVTSRASSMVSQTVSDLLSMASRGASAVAQMAGQVASHFLQMESRGISAVASMAGQVAGQAASMAGRFVGAVSSMAGQAVGRMRSMAGQMVSAVAGVAGQMAGVGRSMISGLVGGIQSMAGAAVHAAASVAGNAISAAKAALGINSPSKVFHEIGAGTIEGFVNGLNANASAVQAGYSKTFAPHSGAVAPLSVLSAQTGNAYAAAAPGSAGNVTIPVYIGNQQVAQLVLDKATNKLKQSGVSRMRR